MFVLPLCSMLGVFVSHFQLNFWFLPWLLGSIGRKFLCKTVVSEICVTSLGKIQMTVWFNPFGAVALNHCSCCWHTSPQKPGSRWYKFICVSTGENSDSLELQSEVFASVLNIFGEWAGSASPSALWEDLLCFSHWNKLSSRSCCLSENHTVGTFSLIPSDPGHSLIYSGNVDQGAKSIHKLPISKYDPITYW